MTGFILFILIGISAGLLTGKIHKNRYGLARFSNCLIGLVGALFAGSIAVIFSSSGLFIEQLTLTPIIAATAGAFFLVWLAGALRGTQYE